MNNTRRDFLAGLTKVAGGAMLGYVSLPLLASPTMLSCSPTSVPLVPEATTTPIGPDGRVAVNVSALTQANPALVAPNVFGLDGFGVMVTLTSDGAVHAFSMKCTHQSCAVDSQLAHDEIHCSCHGSTFRLDGSVDQGPATVALTSYPVLPIAADHVAHIQIIPK